MGAPLEDSYSDPGQKSHKLNALNPLKTNISHPNSYDQGTSRKAKGARQVF